MPEVKNTPSDLTRHPHGISTVDAHYVRPGYASVHVVERKGRALIVDTGSNTALPYVLAALDQLGLEPAVVESVFITHAHLDHAGGAGLLMSQLPNARAIVHPRAAPHLSDPTRLAQATRQVYGDERFEELYGSLLPIARERLIETRDLDRFTLGGSAFQVLHTPGHALHHHVLHDLDARSLFTGDTFGLSYRWLDSDAGACIFPTTTPTQFDPDQLKHSINRMLALDPEAMYLTHFGRVTGVAALGASLHSQIDELVAMAHAHADSTDPHANLYAAMQRSWLERVQKHGARLDVSAALELLSGDLELNTQGLLAWLARSRRG